MTITKHTPGPWIAKKAAGWFITRPDAVKRREAAIAVGMTPAHTMVADPTVKWFEEGEAEANAKLMAASPELLEAAKGMLSALEGNFYQPRQAAFQALENAIAKAESSPQPN